MSKKRCYYCGQSYVGQNKKFCSRGCYLKHLEERCQCEYDLAVKMMGKKGVVHNRNCPKRS